MRAKPLGGALVAALIFASLACAGAPAVGTASKANADACKRYVNVFNEASCAALDLDAEALCPDTLDLSSCDLAPYWDCLAGAVKCSGDFLDISEQGRCKMPACN